MKLPTKYTQLAHDKDINAMDVSPNDKLMVTGSQDKTAKLWNASDGGLVGVLRGHRRGIWSVQFSPVDQCVLTASADTTLKLWAVSDCSCIKTFEGHTMSVLKAVFITRGMQIASRSPMYNT
jgi:U3 small nucleolar RNA-associated protein 13